MWKEKALKRYDAPIEIITILLRILLYTETGR